MNYKIINPETINKSMMDNEEMVKQFVEMYLFQSPIDFEKLEIAVKEKDFESISNAAHHIKPTMEYIGASPLRLEFQELENLGKDKADIHTIEKKFNQIKTSFDLLLTELKDLNK